MTRYGNFIFREKAYEHFEILLMYNLKTMKIMKKKILCLTFAIATGIISVLNYKVSVNDDIQFYLSLSEVEALAGGEWNSWDQWLSQGLTKDEREWMRPCPSQESGSGYGNGSYGGVGVGGGGSYSQTNPSGRNEITCPYGNENCTPIGC